MKPSDFYDYSETRSANYRSTGEQNLSLVGLSSPDQMGIGTNFYPTSFVGDSSGGLVSRKILPSISIGEEAGNFRRPFGSDDRRPQFFVATNGSDTNDGSAARPWKTIQKGAADALPGSVVNVMPGVYFGHVDIKVSGNERDGYTTFRSVVPGRAVLDLSEETRMRKARGEDAEVDTVGFSIKNKNFVEVSGFEVKNLRASSSSSTPYGVLVKDSKHVVLTDLNIHHIENNISRESNAHGIAILGTGTTNSGSTSDIVIANSRLHDLKLGASEALVVNGNVERFKISNNQLYRLNNIAVDVVGFEGVSKSKFDQPRQGIIQNNSIFDVDSKGNPAYGKSRSAGGIYVDGGTQITISGNHVERANIGIELASEHYGKSTSSVYVTGNTLRNNTLAGVILGGASRSNGGSFNNVIENNVLQHNDTDGTGTGEIGFQHFVSGVTVRNNRILTDNARIVSGSTQGNIVEANDVRRSISEST
ncbi:MAG TPA: right-handed parallel beta-helix repeat-containing protein [Drouetiella sp.]